MFRIILILAISYSFATGSLSFSRKVNFSFSTEVIALINNVESFNTYYPLY